MKEKRTMRDIKSQYPTIVQVSYCDAQNMLCMDDPAAYTAGVYGWNADIYSITSEVAICTGYRPFGNIKPDRETVSRYEKRAREMRRDLWSVFGARHEKYLWAENVKEQIESMLYLYDSIKQEPEWLTREQILDYKKLMEG